MLADLAPAHVNSMPDHVAGSWCHTGLLGPSSVGHFVTNHFWSLLTHELQLYRRRTEFTHARGSASRLAGWSLQLCQPASLCKQETRSAHPHHPLCHCVSTGGGRQASKLDSRSLLPQVTALRCPRAGRVQERGELCGQALCEERGRCRYWIWYCCNAARGAGALTASSLWQLAGKAPRACPDTYRPGHQPQLIHYG